MLESFSTCWTMVRGAATGGEKERDQFAALYAPVVRDYLAARWARSPLTARIDDTVQDIFVECF
jgi:RNA polymerase sigma-70 factor (ECF subfamily)